MQNLHVLMRYRRFFAGYGTKKRKEIIEISGIISYNKK